jgi:hypothetical protein
VAQNGRKWQSFALIRSYYEAHKYMIIRYLLRLSQAQTGLSSAIRPGADNGLTTENPTNPTFMGCFVTTLTAAGRRIGNLRNRKSTWRMLRDAEGVLVFREEGSQVPFAIFIRWINTDSDPYMSLNPVYYG